MSRRTSLANKAIAEAWKKEQQLVKEGKGTRQWTEQQQRDILEFGKAYDEDGKSFEGQHMKSVEKYPEYQGDSGNIQFLTKKEHLEAHDGNWKNPTNWYYDYQSKERIDFGEGPYIPCEIVELKIIIADDGNLTYVEDVKNASVESDCNKPTFIEEIKQAECEYFKEHGVEILVSSLCRGVANACVNKVLNRFNHSNSTVIENKGDSSKLLGGTHSSPKEHSVSGYTRMQNGKTVNVKPYKRGGNK